MLGSDERHDGSSHRDRLRLVPVPHRLVGRRSRAAFSIRALAGFRLRAQPRRLLHVLDLLRLGRARLPARARFSADLYRPHSRHRPWRAVHRAHRQSRACPERHHGRRFRFRPLWKIPARRRDRRADRAHRFRALCGDPAQSGRGDRPDGGQVLRSRASHAGDALDLLLPRGVLGSRAVRDGLRHKAHQPQGASGRPHSRDRRRSRSSSWSPFSPSAPSSSGG